MKIIDQVSLEKWLEEHEWFQNQCYVTDIIPSPKPDISALSEGKILFKIWSSGSPAAGSLRTWACYELKLESINRWYLPDPSRWSTMSYSYGFDLLESGSPGGIGFYITLPSEDAELGDLVFEVDAGSMSFKRLVDQQDTVEPWRSSSNFSVYAKNVDLPTPEEWIDLFENEGLSVAWRYHHGEAKPALAVPTKDYSGWFLQLQERIPVTKGGLFFFACKPDENGFYLQIEDKEPSEIALGVSAGKILAKLGNIEVCSGNCTLTNQEWLAFLEELTIK